MSKASNMAPHSHMISHTCNPISGRGAETVPPVHKCTSDVVGDADTEVNNDRRKTGEEF